MTKQEKERHSADLTKAEEKLKELELATKRIGLFELSQELQYIRGSVSFTAYILKGEIEK